MTPRLRLASLAVLVLVLPAVIIACGDNDDTPASADWPAFYSLAELADASDIIVVAQLGDEQQHTIEAPAVEGSGPSTIIEIVRAFVVEESLKGDLLPGDIFNVFNTASISTESSDGPTEAVFQVLEIQPEQSYLLFLTLVEVPDYYPDEFGEFAWAAPGEPHTARVLDDGTLQWETTGRYDEAREARTIPAGEQGAGPAFDVTIEAIAAVASQGGGLVPAPGGSPSPSASVNP